MKPQTYPTRDHVFRDLWLPTIDPQTPTTVFQNTQLGLLKDLYPNIWRYGPRGDIYINQLTTLKNLFDTFAANPHHGGVFHFTKQYLPGFNQTFNLTRYTIAANRHLAKELKNQYRAPAPYWHTAHEDPYGILNPIRNHPVLPTTPDIQQQMTQFIDNLSYHSLQRDILANHKSNRRLLDAWEHYAKTWQFDTA